MTSFGGATLRDSPKMDPLKINFLHGSKEGASFFDINTYLTDTYFDIL